MEVVNNKIQRSRYFLLRQAMLFQYSLTTINLDKIRMADSRGSLDSPSHKERGHQLGGRLGCEVNALVLGVRMNMNIGIWPLIP